MLRKILLYFKKLIINLFSGFDIVLTIAGILSFVLNYTLPNFPSCVTTILTIIIILISSCRVWLEESDEKDKALKELSKIKNKSPNYSIEAYVVPDVFSIKEKISLVDQEIIDSSNAKRLNNNSLPAMTVVGGEKLEDKIRRLTKYRQELEKYDKDIKNLHKISIQVSSDKADKNVEIELKTANSDPLFIEDNYIINNIPTETLDLVRRPYVMPPPITTNDSVEAGSVAKISLKALNPKQCYKIPDQELYVKTTSQEATLIVTIYSENLQEPKTEMVKVDFRTK